MRPPDVFQVSEKTVALARACRKNLPEEELPMLDISSKSAPASNEEFNIDIAREAIGERLLGLISTIARWEGTTNPQSQSVTFAHANEGKETVFIEKIRQGIAEHLGLDPKHPQFQTFLQKLREDLHSWLPQNPMGIAEEPDGSLSCTCPDLTPILEPLDPLERESTTP